MNFINTNINLTNSYSQKHNGLAWLGLAWLGSRRLTFLDNNKYIANIKGYQKLPLWNDMYPLYWTSSERGTYQKSKFIAVVFDTFFRFYRYCYSQYKKEAYVICWLSIVTRCRHGTRWKGVLAI